MLEFFKKMAMKTKIFIGGGLVGIIIFIIVLLLISNNDGELNIITKSSLDKVIGVEELSTIEYTYNAVATKKDEDNKDMYYVAYEGKVNAGIDFKELDVKKGKNDTIVVTLPDVEIQKVIVDINSFDFIYKRSKYETENITQEAYKLCKEDLKKRVSKDINFEKMARENAVETIEALFKPWIESLEGNYTLVIK